MSHTPVTACLRAAAAVGLAALATGCSTAPSLDWAALPAGAMLAKDAGYLKMPMIAGAVVFYIVLDPLAPNWTIEESRQADDRYILALRHKAIHNGGDGEARQVFTRRAAQLAGQPGFGAYEVLTWQQGIESSRPFAQRVAYGEVRLLRVTPPVAAAKP